jgi:hypothetical protein
MNKVSKYVAPIIGLLGLFSVVSCAQQTLNGKIEPDGFSLWHLLLVQLKRKLNLFGMKLQR